jgi:hypothetical protein
MATADLRKIKEHYHAYNPATATVTPPPVTAPQGQWIPVPLLKKGQPKLVTPTTPTAKPTLSSMLVHFTQAMAKWTVAGFPTVDQETYLQRRTTCELCAEAKSCPVCGCRLWAKCAIATEKCPKNLWIFGTPLSYYHGNSAKIFWAKRTPLSLVNMYAGQSAFLLGNGPSMKSVDLNLFRQRGIFTMGVNNGPAVFRPDALVLCDPPYKFHEYVWRDPGFLKFTPTRNLKRRIALGNTNNPGPRVWDMPGVIGFENGSMIAWDSNIWIDSSNVNWGVAKHLNGNRSVLLAAIHLLYFLGFTHVYLWGVDFKMDAAQPYAFAQGRTPASLRNNANLFHNINSYLTDAQPHLTSRGFFVYNCTVDSGLTAFPYLDLSQALARSVLPDPNTAGCYERNGPDKPKPQP